jgi:hypothetical protein
LLSAGSRIAINNAMIPITTSNSTSVNAAAQAGWRDGPDMGTSGFGRDTDEVRIYDSEPAELSLLAERRRAISNKFAEMLSKCQGNNR